MGLFHYYNIYFNNNHDTIQVISQKPIFLKSGQLITGLSKAWVGVGNNEKELSFSDHTHNLPDLDGILTTDKGGTGVSNLNDLKTTLGLSDTSSYYIVMPIENNGMYLDVPVPDGWVCYIAFGPNLRFGYRSTDNPDKYYSITIKGSSTKVATFSSGSYDYISNAISLNTEYTTVAVVFY